MNKMPDLSAEAKRKIDKLNKAYLDSFPEKRSELQVLWKNLQSNEYSKAALTELAAFCHKIAGSAGSYNYLDISQSAHSVEEYCHNGFSNIDLRKASVIELKTRYLNLAELLNSAKKQL
jgi:HPt (histidine-containing phosphotransfer) domain-containing protein